jgi:hypothetical protein
LFSRRRLFPCRRKALHCIGGAFSIVNRLYFSEKIFGSAQSPNLGDRRDQRVVRMGRSTRRAGALACAIPAAARRKSEKFDSL